MLPAASTRSMEQQGGDRQEERNIHCSVVHRATFHQDISGTITAECLLLRFQIDVIVYSVADYSSAPPTVLVPCRARSCL